jgi:hypothetical protein
MDTSAKMFFGEPVLSEIRLDLASPIVVNPLSADLIEAICRYIAATEDPDSVTDALETALHLGGMTANQVYVEVEKYLPKS